MKSIVTEKISISYEHKNIIEDLSIEIPKGKITVIIGPNGCGKSTTLKAISRTLKNNKGTIYLSGKDINTLKTKDIAKKMAILPQAPEAPGGLTVEELVSYGRFPHQNGFGTLKDEDKRIIDWAIEVTNLNEFKDNEIDYLSGGQRQRAWIAMSLAQETELILLDEPTTYLDLCHQLEVLELLKELNEEKKRTIVMVLHDLNLASRFGDYLIAMKDGKVIKEGTAFEVMTKESLKEVFTIDGDIEIDNRTGKPICASYDLIK